MKYLAKTSGYAYAGENLYKVEIVRQEISRADENCEPIVELTVRTGDGKEFPCTLDEIYESPSAYEEGRPMELRSFDSLAELCGIRREYYVVEDSQVKEIDPNKVWRTVVGTPNGGMFFFECAEIPKECYYSENEAKSFNCINVVDENGESREEKGGALLARLDDDQRSIIAELEAVLEKAKGAGIQILHDVEDKTLCAFNGRHGNIYSSYGKEDDSWKEIVVYGHKEFTIKESVIRVNWGDDAFYFDPKKETAETAEEK